MKFLLDTNFLLSVPELKIDIFTELQKFGKPEFFTLNLVIKELEKMNTKKSGFALKLVTDKKIKILNSVGDNADRELEIFTLEQDFILCTQDKELKDRIKKLGGEVVFIRQGKYLEK